MAEFPAPHEGIVLTHFVVSSDVERSRRFYTEVLGGELVLEGEPSIVALANGWVIINVGGGPTDDKPTVTLDAPSDPDRVSGEWPGALQPQALAEPYVSLSTHTAPTIRSSGRMIRQ
jgi:catechol 2,3-dioxygenase-like lactoylglutathione lyase family enzyme